VLEFDPFVDAINERLQNLIDNGAGSVVFYTRMKADECEWRRERYAVRLARYAQGGVVVNRFTDDRRAGPAQAIGMDADGIADVADVVLEHAANPDSDRDHAHHSS
jgi:hypothetical protein